MFNKRIIVLITHDLGIQCILYSVYTLYKLTHMSLGLATRKQGGDVGCI